MITKWFKFLSGLLSEVLLYETGKFFMIQDEADSTRSDTVQGCAWFKTVREYNNRQLVSFFNMQNMLSTDLIKSSHILVKPLKCSTKRKMIFCTCLHWFCIITCITFPTTWHPRIEENLWHTVTCVLFKVSKVILNLELLFKVIQPLPRNMAPWAKYEWSINKIILLWKIWHATVWRYFRAKGQ